MTADKWYRLQSPLREVSFQHVRVFPSSIGMFLVASTAISACSASSPACRSDGLAQVCAARMSGNRSVQVSGSGFKARTIMRLSDDLVVTVLVDNDGGFSGSFGNLSSSGPSVIRAVKFDGTSADGQPSTITFTWN